MAHVAVTLQYNNTSKDLALPLDVTVRLLIDSLVQALQLRKPRGQRYSLSIRTEQGLRPIPFNATLADANVLHGMVLMLLIQEQKVADNLSPITAYLEAENGQKFALTNKVTVIGRSDSKSGIFVDVDLKSLATDPKLISRRHAQIEQEGDRFYLIDLVSANGTQVNGQGIRSKEKHTLRDGDVMEFGRNGVRLTFTGSKKQ